MGYQFNPFTGNFDLVGSGGSSSPSQTNLGNSSTYSGNVSVDLSSGSAFLLTVNTTTILSFTSGMAGQTARLTIRQDGTGSRKVTFGPNIYFSGAGVPTVGLLSNSETVLDIYWDGTQAVIGRGGSVFGRIPLVVGTATVSNPYVTTTSSIIYSVQAPGGTQGFLSVTSTNGSFTINSTSATETSSVAWLLLPDSRAFTSAFANSQSLNINNSLSNSAVSPTNVLFDTDLTTPFSMSAWVRVNAITSYQALFGTTNGGGTIGKLLRIETGGNLLVLLRTAGTTQLLTSTSGIAANAWYHLVVTYSGNSNISGAKVYINAVDKTPAASGAITGTLAAGGPLYIGSWGYNAFPVDGYVTQVAYWSGTAISSSDVTALYNAGSPPDVTALSCYASNTAYWPIGYGNTSSSTVQDVNNGYNLTNYPAGTLLYNPIHP